MRLKPFELERYFAKHEFSAPYLLCSSDCDGWPLQELLKLADEESRALWDGLRLGYTESLGLAPLRREIAALYRGVAAEDVLVLAPQEGVLVAMSCLLEKGDHVLCAYPGYQSLYEVAEGIGCEWQRWLPEESTGWRFDVEALSRMIRPQTKLIVVNFPHNPTGALPSREDFRRLLDLARERGIHLFSDEMYRFLEVSPEDRLPSACELYDKAVTLFGMSKTFGLAGLRIGWLITKDRALYARMAQFKDYTTICSAAPSEILALIGLRAKDAILSDHKARIAENLSLLDGFFQRQSALLRWTRPRGGTVCFPALKVGAGAEEFCSRALEASGVLLMPSSVYGYGDSHFRLGYGRRNMPEALGRLERHLTGAR